RRFEKMKDEKGILYYDDYAHHPEEIKSALKAAKRMVSKKTDNCDFSTAYIFKNKGFV
ncbi:UDP-N-acetylmuramate--L-alanine ligase, partial [Patescibacteria group bacterium]|nr:UDP-N-acetylmuramate--L-alanine ligase [Patescibacteria group bacterium]